MISKIKRLYSLDFNYQKLFVQLVLLLPVITLSVKRIGFRRTDLLLAWLYPAKVFPLTEDQAIEIITSTVQMFRLASRAFSSATCLANSLVLWHLMRHQGLDCELQFGVKKGTTTEYNAHAWVEYKGVVLNDRSDIRCEYEPFNMSINKKI